MIEEHDMFLQLFHGERSSLISGGIKLEETIYVRPFLDFQVLCQLWRV